MPTYNTGLINQTMRVTGAGLYAVSGVQVPNAGFIDFSYFDASPEYIEFKVPENIVLGRVNFHFITGQSLSDPLYVSGVEFFPIPRLDSVIPNTQEVGGFVAVSGKSLSGVQYVSFNNITGTNISYDSTSGVLFVKVPSGYTTGPIRISGYNNTGIARVTSDFNFFGRIYMSGFSSNIPYEGDLLTISGKNFNLSYVNESYFPVNFTTSVDNGVTGFVTAKFTGVGDTISGIVPENANVGFVTINSIDDTSFTSQNSITVLKAPFVASALNYYLNSGQSNIAIGKNFNYATGIILSGLNFRQPKTVLNSGITTSSNSLFRRSLLFSGNGYLQVPSPASGDFQFGTSAFTIEFLINPLPYTTAQRIDLFQDLGWDGNGFAFYKPATSTDWIFYAAGITKANIATSQIPANSWTKVIISRFSPNGDTFVAASGINTQISSTVSVGSPYTITAGSGLSIGSDALKANTFSGYLEDFRIVKGFGLYNNINQVSRSSGLIDIPNTVLLLQGDYSDYDYRANRINISSLREISGYVEDYNYNPYNNSYLISSLAKNSTNSTLTFTGTNVPPGAYDITIRNSGGRDFLFENFEVIRGNPVIKNVSTFENYAGGLIKVIGHNIYPDSQFLFQDTGDATSNVDATESTDSYLYQSTFRSKKPIVFNSISINANDSKFDNRSFLFSGTSSPYIKFSITGAYPNIPLSYGKSFALELDFKPLISFPSTDRKFLIGTQSGVNVFVTNNYLVVSGIDWNGFNPIFSGAISTNSWNHLSISKSYNNQNSISGKILLNGSGISLFSNSDQFDFATSNFDFSLNADQSLSSPVFDIYIGRDYANTANRYWSGYIDEIRVVKEDPYKNINFIPIRRARNNNNTEILIHANVGMVDDNIRDFGYLELNTPNLSSIRKTNFIIDNSYSRITGGSDKIFTFLKTPSITGVYPSLLTQGEPLTGYGTDLYYIKSISIGDNFVTGYSVSGLNSEFNHRIIFNIPDLAQSGEYLKINSDYYSYTYPSGLSIKSGNLTVDGFSPLTGIAGTLITLTGKFLNTVSSIELGRQDGAYKVITSFENQSITGLSFYIPQVYDITDGPITLNGSRRFTTTQSLTFVNPVVNKVIPNSAYFNDRIILSGNNLNGFEFYGIGFNDEPIKYSGVSITNSTGALVVVPRDIKRSSFRFFTSGTTNEVKGFSPFFNPSTTITGVRSDNYRTKDSIIITGINAHRSQSRDLYISGFNLLTNKTGQYLISQNMSIIDVSTLSGLSQPYTGYSILSGKLNIYSNDFSQTSDIGLLISGSDALGFGNTINNPGNEILLDGFVGSGNIFFQRNSFDSDNLYNLITIRPPTISNFGIDIPNGTYRSLITITGSNLNYVTGIKFNGESTLLIGASGGASAPEILRANYKSGISQTIRASELSSDVIYKDYSKLQFYPPNMAGKNLHGKDAEDIRLITGMFYLSTYLNEEYPVTGRFTYTPFISIFDAYLNNNLTYRLDGTNQVSGWDGSLISFNGQGVRYLTGVDFFSKTANQIVENYPTIFQKEKQRAVIDFYNSAGSNITGYKIISGGKGYTTSSVSIGFTSSPLGTPTVNGIVSFLPPYVGQITGVSIVSNANATVANFWTGGSNNIVSLPSSGFIIRNPSALLFSGTNYSAQSGDGSYYYAYYTVSTTFPLDNGFVVGEKLNIKLSNSGSVFETSDSPFLVLQNPNNFAKIYDLVLTGSYQNAKNFVIPYSQIFSDDQADYSNLDIQVKASLLYPTGYNGKSFMLTTTKPSKDKNNLIIAFSTNVPPTGSYVNINDPVDSKYLKLRIETVDSQASLFKGLGTVSSQNKLFEGRIGIGSTTTNR